jgi:hypothetical protein
VLSWGSPAAPAVAGLVFFAVACVMLWELGQATLAYRALWTFAIAALGQRLRHLGRARPK